MVNAYPSRRHPATGGGTEDKNGPGRKGSNGDGDAGRSPGRDGGSDAMGSSMVRLRL